MRLISPKGVFVVVYSDIATDNDIYWRSSTTFGASWYFPLSSPSYFFIYPFTSILYITNYPFSFLIYICISFLYSLIMKSRTSHTSFDLNDQNNDDYPVVEAHRNGSTFCLIFTPLLYNILYSFFLSKRPG